MTAARLVSVLLLAMLAGAALAAGGPHDATATHSFEDVDHWEKVFDDPGRDAWQKPDALVQQLALRPGMVVADVGAGTGYLSRRLSRAVGPTGTVLAVELEPKLVVHLRDRAEREATPNVVPVLASADNPRLPPGGVDVVLFVDTVHHVDDRVAYLRRLRGALRPDGRVVVVDWLDGTLPVGPPPDHKLPRARLEAEMDEAGYVRVADADVLPYQFFLVFRPR